MDMTEVDCPLECGYSGAPASVEGHISSMTDETHQGEVGRHYQTELEEQLPAVDDPDDLEDEEMADLEAVGHEEMDVDEDVDDDLDREVAAGAAGAAVSAPFLLEEIDVDTRVLLLGGVAMLMLLAFYLRRSSSGSGEETTEEPETAEEPAAEGDGGLI